MHAQSSKEIVGKKNVPGIQDDEALELLGQLEYL